MRAIVQRVKNAKITVGNNIVAEIRAGLLVYLGIGKEDNESDAEFTADKIVNLRIFADPVRDEASEMPVGRQGRPVSNRINFSIKDVDGQILIISNFTLFGDCRKGRRPGFDLAAEPVIAEKLYEKVVELIKAQGLNVQSGIFAAYMDVTASNDGPINFLIDSKKLF